MKGSQIIVSAFPQGVFGEGIISGTPLPGTILELVPGVAPVGGRFTWRATTRAAGAVGPIVVLLEDSLQGFTPLTAYVTGTRCFFYWPLQGESINCLVEVPGTGTGQNATTIGEKLIVAGDNTGKLTLNTLGSPGQIPFQSMEALPDATAGSELVWCMRI